MKRLTPASLTTIMFGVVGLLVMAYVAKNLLAVEEKPREATEDLLPMAIADLPPGTKLTAEHLGMGPFPKKHLQPDMLRKDRVIVGRYTRVPIKAGHPFRANDLLPPNVLPQLKVAEGMRAISVEVGDSTAMVDGMISNGDFVDVLFTYQGNNNNDALQGGLTMRLFEGVRVLAVNRGGNRGDRGSNHVTLELTEQQANVLTLAKSRGNVNLTYNPSGRGHGGLAVTNTERVTLYDILGWQEPVEPFATEIFRGSGRGINRFNDKGRLIDSQAPQTQSNPPQQQLPATPNVPVRPTDSTSADQPTSPTASRLLIEQKK
jgi:pilus assembly protein CpaB